MIVVTQTGRFLRSPALPSSPAKKVPQVSQVLHLLRRNLAPGAAGQILQNNTWNLVMTHEIWILQDTSGYFSPGSCMGQQKCQKASLKLQTSPNKASENIAQVFPGTLISFGDYAAQKSPRLPPVTQNPPPSVGLDWNPHQAPEGHGQIMSPEFPNDIPIISPRFCNQHSSV